MCGYLIQPSDLATIAAECNHVAVVQNLWYLFAAVSKWNSILIKSMQLGCSLKFTVERSQKPTQSVWNNW